MGDYAFGHEEPFVEMPCCGAVIPVKEYRPAMPEFLNNWLLCHKCGAENSSLFLLKGSSVVRSYARTIKEARERENEPKGSAAPRWYMCDECPYVGLEPSHECPSNLCSRCTTEEPADKRRKGTMKCPGAYIDEECSRLLCPQHAKDLAYCPVCMEHLG